KFVKDNGKRKVFHLGSNSSCRQHICSHYKFYKARCRELKIGRTTMRCLVKCCESWRKSRKESR
ncbi:hypothetical protein DFJ58DRAFT_662469, partial [Suillus subalutaceus]|uniref:uncharacterized protein n=1 Tax=Suillus subalutaceus TaxID=48586 RepID=UPI001B85D340